MSTNRVPIILLDTSTETFGIDLPKNALVLCNEDDTLYKVTVDSNTSQALEDVAKTALITPSTIDGGTW